MEAIFVAVDVAVGERRPLIQRRRGIMKVKVGLVAGGRGGVGRNGYRKRNDERDSGYSGHHNRSDEKRRGCDVTLS
jgi:hypothetical protein